jgi:hypothetical protein
MKRDTGLIRIATSLAAVVLLLTGCGTGSTTTETTIPVGTNQKLVSGRIVSILGNEVTLMVLQDTAQTDASGSAATTGTINPAQPSDGGAAGSTANGDPSGNPANGGTRPSGTWSGSNGTSSSHAANTNGGSGSVSLDAQSATGETLSFMIPVGTKITTTLGKTTTFSRLVAGDSIKVLFETSDDGTSVVVGVWMSEN